MEDARMPRKAWVWLTLLAAFAPGYAHAEGWFPKIRRDFRRNNCWPQPFNIPDRIAVRSPFEVMIDNGWQVQNTLSDEHFDPETGELIGAGELKVRSILIESPKGRRRVFVLRGKDPEDTVRRERSVQQYAARILHPGERPEIGEASFRPRGTPAERIFDIDSRYSASAPDPRLSPAGGGGGGGSGGGASGSPGGR
jgi:hypothetical protein